MKFIQSFICNNCFNTVKCELSIKVPSLDKNSILYPDGSYINAKFFCKKCKRITDHFNVDCGISKLVSLFNKNGFQTDYSCQGHLRMDKEFIYEWVMTLSSDAYVEYLLDILGIQDSYIKFTTDNCIFNYKEKEIYNRKFSKEAFYIILKSAFADIDFTYLNQKENYQKRVHIKNGHLLLKKEIDELYSAYKDNELTSGLRIGLCMEKAIDKLVNIIEKYKHRKTKESIDDIRKEYEEYCQTCIDKLYTSLSEYFKTKDDKSDIVYFDIDEYLKQKKAEETS